MPSVRVIGPGRAGGAMSTALARSGWDILAWLGRSDDLWAAADGVDLLLVATPDGVVSEVASAVNPVGSTVVAHLSGSLGLAVLEPHPRPAAIHPLVALPSAEVGADRLLAGAWFAVAGDAMANRVVADLGGTAFEIGDADRAAYHAAAVIASNHLVALLGQAERVAADAGVPLDAYLGPAEALTGPAARGDWETIRRHLAALDPSEHDAYKVMVDAARRLVEEESVNNTEESP